VHENRLCLVARHALVRHTHSIVLANTAMEKLIMIINTHVEQHTCSVLAQKTIYTRVTLCAVGRFDTALLLLYCCLTTALLWWDALLLLDLKRTSARNNVHACHTVCQHILAPLREVVMPHLPPPRA
jgi:hypothetical protein